MVHAPVRQEYFVEHQHGVLRYLARTASRVGRGLSMFADQVIATAGLVAMIVFLLKRQFAHALCFWAVRHDCRAMFQCAGGIKTTSHSV